MFEIIKNHKPIVLNCYTHNYADFEYFQVKKSSYFKPEWWKSLPKTQTNELGFQSNKNNNMRHCPGFVEMFKKSFTFPLPTDVYISAEEQKVESSKFDYGNEVNDSTNPVYSYEATINGYVESHNPKQFNNAFRPGFCHIKINNGWFFETKEDLDWIIVPAFWNLEKKVSDIFIPPAIDNYKHQHFTTWQFFIKTNGKPVFLEAGEPLVYMIPKTERKVIVKSHYDPDKCKKLKEKSESKFINNSYYKKLKKLIK